MSMNQWAYKDLLLKYVSIITIDVKFNSQYLVITMLSKKVQESTCPKRKRAKQIEKEVYLYMRIAICNYKW